MRDALIHVVLTHDRQGLQRLYVDGAVSAEEQRAPGDTGTSHWPEAAGLGLRRMPFTGGAPGDAER